MIVPPPPSPDGSPEEQQPKPSKHPLHCLVGTDSYVEVWTDPIRGRDQGLALIGRRVRCCFTRDIISSSSSSETTSNSNTSSASANGVVSENGKQQKGQQKSSKKTKNFIVEGEVISILNVGDSDWADKEEGGKRQQRRSTSTYGTSVELLIDREVLTKVPFLERTDEDIDINDLKKESAKRAHRNEEAIRGKNKVSVKVHLGDSSGLAIPTKITTEGSSSSSRSIVKSSENTAKWAIRKRIPNEPGQPLLLEQNKTNGSVAGGSSVGSNKKQSNGIGKVGDEEGGEGAPSTAESTKQKSQSQKGMEGKKVANGSNKKAPTPPTQFMGNRNDDAAQQQKNWRWFAARFYDMYLAETASSSSSRDTAEIVCNRNTIGFLQYYSELLASCGGLVGEVLEVTPSSRGGTLAMVTLRRLILPEHTACGGSSTYRQEQQGGRNGKLVEIFDDYDSTLIGRKKKSDGNDDDDAAENNNNNNGQDPKKRNDEGLASVVFRVPIEELVIVSRQLKRNFQNSNPQPANTMESSNDESTMMDELAIASSYSWKGDCFIPLKHMVPKKVDGETPIPRPLTKKKLKKVSLCHRCRTWLLNKQVATCDNLNCALSQCMSSCAGEEEGEEDKAVSLGWCKLCMDSMRGIESVIDQDFSTDTLESLGDLPCCLSLCDCRRCHLQVSQQKGEEDLTTALENAPAGVSTKGGTSGNKGDIDGEINNSPFGDTISMLQTMKSCSFDIPSNFIDMKCLPLSGSKLITRATKPSVRKGGKGNNSNAGEKRKRDTPPNKKAPKRQKASNSRPGTPPPPPSGVPIQKAARRTSEDYSVFKPSCSRLMDRGAIAAAKAKRDADEERVLSGKLVSGDKPRNLREIMEKARTTSLDYFSGKKIKKGEKKVLSSRAARANQRRLAKDVAMLGASSLNLDMLAGRESQLRFDRSGIHGWGVFTDVEISAEDLIIEYRGVIIGNAMAEKREREYELAKIGSDYMFRIDSLTVCDATKQGNVARFINASCDPNCYTKIITLDGRQRIVIYAKKDIKVGEELCYDYKFELEHDESKRIPCCCGSQDCKGFMNWDKNLD